MRILTYVLTNKNNANKIKIKIYNITFNVTSMVYKVSEWNVVVAKRKRNKSVLLCPEAILHPLTCYMLFLLVFFFLHHRRTFFPHITSTSP